MRLRIGLRFDAFAPPASGADPGAGDEADRLAGLIEQAATAEALGVDIAWLRDRPERPAAALPLCAAVASRATRIRVGAGPLALPLHHPLRLAEDAASADALSGGRLELALGLGRDPRGADAFGIAAQERAVRFEEGLELLRRAWADGVLDFRGRHFSVSGVDVVPKPVQKPGPTLWIAARSHTAMRRAARLGAGLLADAPDAAGVFLSAWRGAGRAAGAARVALELPLLLAADAPRLAREVSGLAPLSGAAPPPEGSVAFVCLPDEAAGALAGALEPLREAGSVDLILPASWPGVPAGVARESARLLSRVVRPALEGWLGGGAGS